MKNREQGKSDAAGDEKLRLFFALWPEQKVAAALRAVAQQCRADCGGRVMRQESIHMTLLFLGATPAKRLPQLKRAVAGLSVPGFDLALDRVAGWKHNSIGYAAPAEAHDSLVRLVRGLRERVGAAGFQFDARKFTPHVTLLRKTEQMLESRPFAPIPWRVNDFVLVQSAEKNGVPSYRILQCWPLS